MKLYGGIDLHSNNNMTVLVDEENRVVFARRITNEMDAIRYYLEPYREQLVALAVESTYNWYWLVDGLMEAGFNTCLANPSAMKQYEGLKHTDDGVDARWIANMLRLGILPTGYIYPKKDRPVRDLLRKRSQMVRYHTSNLLAMGNLVARNLGFSVAKDRWKKLEDEDIDMLMKEADLSLAVKSNLAVLRCVDEQIKIIERVVKARAKLRPEFKQLLTVSGIGEILAMTIAYETGEISRFPTVGDYSSYCRCVKSDRLSNGKKKGKGNARNGNKYLAWAFVEAAANAIRYNDKARRFYQRKSAKAKSIVARKALANKLARACYYIMRDRVPFDNERLFAR